MTHLSLFSGIGGIDIAAHWAGFETVQFVERDPFCQKVLAKNFPGVPIHDDITTFDAEAFMKTVAEKDKYPNILAEYESGMSVGDIAAAYGVTRQSMWKSLVRRGCTFRPNLRYGEDNTFYRGGAKADDAAHNMVERAIETGGLVRPSVCECCGAADQPFKDGRSSIQAHHPDYSRPLEVVWLCQPCHHYAHKSEWEKVKEVMPGEPVAGLDLVSAGFPERPANLTALQEAVKRLVTSVTCGVRSSEYWAKQDPDGSWVRTSQDSLALNLEGSSAEWSTTWPRWGTGWDGVCMEHPTLGLVTGGTGSSSLPTPNAFDAIPDFGNRKDNNLDAGGRHGVSLRHMTKTMLPTPRTCSAMAAALNPNAEFPNLETVIAREMLPTARSSPAMSPPLKVYPSGDKGRLEQVMATGDTANYRAETGEAGLLNPSFVAAMMGFPDSWFDIE